MKAETIRTLNNLDITNFDEYDKVSDMKLNILKANETTKKNIHATSTEKIT